MRWTLPHCVVRTYRPDDAITLARHADDRRIWRNLRDAFPHPYSVADAERFIAHACGEVAPSNFCIATPQDEPIGGIGFRRHDDVERVSGEIGYWLGVAFWGRGIATEAVVTVTAHALTDHGLVRLYAVPYAWNRASSRVLEKSGYSFEGRLRRAAFKDGQFVDQLLYAQVRDPGAATP